MKRKDIWEKATKMAMALEDTSLTEKIYERMCLTEKIELHSTGHENHKLLTGLGFEYKGEGGDGHQYTHPKKPGDVLNISHDKDWEYISKDGHTPAASFTHHPPHDSLSAYMTAAGPKKLGLKEASVTERLPGVAQSQPEPGQRGSVDVSKPPMKKTTKPAKPAVAPAKAKNARAVQPKKIELSPKGAKELADYVRKESGTGLPPSTNPESLPGGWNKHLEMQDSDYYFNYKHPKQHVKMSKDGKAWQHMHKSGHMYNEHSPEDTGDTQETDPTTRLHKHLEDHSVNDMHDAHGDVDSNKL